MSIKVNIHIAVNVLRCIIVLTWRTGTGRFETFTVSCMTIPRASMRFWFGTSNFTLASISGRTWAFIPAENPDEDRLIVFNEIDCLSMCNVKLICNLPFFHLSRIDGRRCGAKRFSADYHFPSTGYFGKAFWTTTSRSKVTAAFEFFLQSQILSRSITH